MDGVKNLLRRPPKENGTSRVSDRSLLERVELPQSGESSKDSSRPKRSSDLKSSGSVEWFKNSSVQSVARLYNCFSGPLKSLRL
jgi:hypothetical protein